MHHNLQIIPIPAFKDNYIWLMHNGQQAVVIDPGDALPVMETLTQLKLNLHSLLITHHHQDHIAGVESLLQAYPKIEIYAPKLEHYDFKHHPVCEADVINLPPLDLSFTVMALPGHTLGHVAYYAENSRAGNLLFCGDTLFGAGCGRLFEGTAAQMYDSLQKLAALAPSAQVYCSHEYTLRNIEFAITLEPGNRALQARRQQTQELRQRGQPSLPSTIALELMTNPFLRCHTEEIRIASQLNDTKPLAVFSRIRELRNLY